MDYDTGALLASGAFLYVSLTFLTRNIHRIVPLPIAPSDTSWWTHRATDTSVGIGEAGVTSSNPSNFAGHTSTQQLEPSISVRYHDGRRVPAEDQIPLSVLETLIRSPVWDIRQAAEVILARRYALHPYTRRNLKRALLQDESTGNAVDNGSNRVESENAARQDQPMTINRPTLQALEDPSPLPAAPTNPSDIIDSLASHVSPSLSPTALPDDSAETHEGALFEVRALTAQPASQALATDSPPLTAAARLSLDQSPRSLAISVILQLPSHLRSQLQILASSSSASASQQQQQQQQYHQHHHHHHHLHRHRSPAERRLRFEELEQRGEIARAARRGHHGWTQE